ncbi:MAG: PAS domain S-box protein [Deltaproteobacteria bacterium]|nr:PAS domain S-box protein [Deltaproteobacteria bacterium]
MTSVAGPVSSEYVHGADLSPIGEASSSLLNLILAATNDGVMNWNFVDGTIAYSERWKSLLGYENHELLDAPGLWRDLSHPDDVEEADALLGDHFENLWPFAHTWRMRHKNGDWRWALCRAVTIRDARGAPVRCVGVFTDVTDQVLAERRLAELKRRNDLLLTSADEGFLGIDDAGVITFANPAALQLLGYTATDVTGRLLPDVVGHGCPVDQACTPAGCPILRPFSGGAAHKVANALFRRQDGSCFTVDYSSTPAREAGRVVGVVLTFRDVTEQRRLETQHLQGQKLEALGQLAAGIAHEINTPMQYVGDNVFFLGTAFEDLMTLINEYRNVVGVLKAEGTHPDLWDRVSQAEAAADMTYLEESLPKAIASTQDGIGRVRKIVYAMKEFSHPGRAEKAPEDLNHAIECTTVISANTWKHVADLEMRFDTDLPKVNCYLGEINQVVLNLIVNAAHAIADVLGENSAGARGTIIIETGQKDGFAEVRISDTGGGIPEAVRHRIFEPFFTTKEVGRGTGQGLTLARSMIVDRHGGFITFVTEVGKGTTFTFGIPVGSSTPA